MVIMTKSPSLSLGGTTGGSTLTGSSVTLARGEDGETLLRRLALATSESQRSILSDFLSFLTFLPVSGFTSPSKDVDAGGGGVGWRSMTGNSATTGV